MEKTKLFFEKILYFLSFSSIFSFVSAQKTGTTQAVPDAAKSLRAGGAMRPCEGSFPCNFIVPIDRSAAARRLSRTMISNTLTIINLVRRGDTAALKDRIAAAPAAIQARADPEDLEGTVFYQQIPRVKNSGLAVSVLAPRRKRSDPWCIQGTQRHTFHFQ